MEFIVISTLLCVDIGVGVYAILFATKPLTFLEFFDFMYDEKQEIIKILEEENEETRKKAFNNYLELKDELKKLKK
jgi:hypothetical protein